MSGSSYRARELLYDNEGTLSAKSREYLENKVVLTRNGQGMMVVVVVVVVVESSQCAVVVVRDDINGWFCKR